MVELSLQFPWRLSDVVLNYLSTWTTLPLLKEFFVRTLADWKCVFSSHNAYSYMIFFSYAFLSQLLLIHAGHFGLRKKNVTSVENCEGEENVPRIFNLVTWWRRTLSFTLRPLVLRERVHGIHWIGDCVGLTIWKSPTHTETAWGWQSERALPILRICLQRGTELTELSGWN
jgi:hypothetical protein